MLFKYNVSSVQCLDANQEHYWCNDIEVWLDCVRVEELLIFSKLRDKEWYAQGLVFGCNLQMWIKGGMLNVSDIKKIWQATNVHSVKHMEREVQAPFWRLWTRDTVYEGFFWLQFAR